MSSKCGAVVSSKFSALNAEKLPSKGRRYILPSRDRLNVPVGNKGGRYFDKLSDEQSQRLISISSDEELPGDIYNAQSVSSLASDEIIEVLRREGYNLNCSKTAVADYPELDLVPPHVVKERRSICTRLFCCGHWSSCSSM